MPRICQPVVSTLGAWCGVFCLAFCLAAANAAAQEPQTLASTMSAIPAVETHTFIDAAQIAKKRPPSSAVGSGS